MGARCLAPDPSESISWQRLSHIRMSPENPEQDPEAGALEPLFSVGQLVGTLGEP